MTTKQPIFIEHLLCARNYPKNFCRLTGWFSQQLYMGGTVIIPVLQMRKQKQSWFKVFSIENIVLESFSQVLGGLCPPKLLCWHSHSQYLKCDFLERGFFFVLFICFYSGAAPWRTRDLSSPTRDRTHNSRSAVSQLLDRQGSPGERVLKEAVKVKWGLQGGPSSDVCMAGVLVR